MSHSDGSSIRYGQRPFGGGGTEKKMPIGVLCEAIGDFEAGKFRNSTPKLLVSFLEQKGATDTYDKFVRDVLSMKKCQGAFNWDGVQNVTLESNRAFALHSIQVILCNRRMASGPEGGQGGFAQWFEYVDLAVQKDYKPDELYDPSLKPCCACSIM
mmetsp:Transcript_67807/g.106757  ORF Transcript_67807/g.106757 Transcript_67807/m.106757 type:complete len:156 (+) Transcript_67807:104-571(+)